MGHLPPHDAQEQERKKQLPQRSAGKSLLALEHHGVVNAPDDGILGSAVDHRHHHRFGAQKDAEHRGCHIGHIAHRHHQHHQRPLVPGDLPEHHQADAKEDQCHNGRGYQHRKTRAQKDIYIDGGKGFHDHGRIADIKQKLDEAVKVYNLEIEEYHTYYVSGREVLVHNVCGVESGRASELPTIEKGTKEWDEAVKSIANGGNTSYRTKTATEAKELLNEARGNMNRYKQYTSKQYKKGYEMHPNEINTRNAPHNDLPHVKWKDWLDELHSGKGHIFFDKPN